MSAPNKTRREKQLQWLIFIEATTFVIAAFIHAGILITGYEHQKACIAETVIATVLIGGLIASWLQPRWTYKAAFSVQGFALLGTLIGVFTIAIGVGPRTIPDLLYHAIILAVLGWGLKIAARNQGNVNQNNML